MIKDRLCKALRRHLAGPGRPVVPAGGELLWSWFVDLSAARTWSVSGPDPIGFAAIESYRRLSGWPIEERHVGILMEMDETFRLHFRGGAERRVSSRPLTAALFDASFG